MANNKILYSSFIQMLVKSATDVNEQIHKSFLQTLRSSADDDDIFIIPPTPLVITDMKISFSANVSRGVRPLDGDLVLDFGKSSNFHGEIKLCPHGTNQPDVLPYQETDDEDDDIDPIYPNDSSDDDNDNGIGLYHTNHYH